MRRQIAEVLRKLMQEQGLQPDAKGPRDLTVGLIRMGHYITERTVRNALAAKHLLQRRHLLALARYFAVPVDVFLRPEMSVGNRNDNQSEGSHGAGS